MLMWMQEGTFSWTQVEKRGRIKDGSILWGRVSPLECSEARALICAALSAFCRYKINSRTHGQLVKPSLRHRGICDLRKRICTSYSQMLFCFFCTIRWRQVNKLVAAGLFSSRFFLIAAASSGCVREADFTSRAAGHIYHPARPPENHLQLTRDFTRRPTAFFLFIMNSASHHADPLFLLGWTQKPPLAWDIKQGCLSKKTEQTTANRPRVVLLVKCE